MGLKEEIFDTGDEEDLKSIMNRKNIKAGYLKEKLALTPEELESKINKISSFTIREAETIIKELKLSREEALHIFIN